MSRRRPSVDHMQVVLDVLCPKDHRVGIIVKLLEPYPNAGTYQVGLPLRFEDLPDPLDESGRVRGRCLTCGADVQIAWGRATAALDEHETRGRHTGSIK